MERLALDRWSSPWLRHQHVARYQWSATLARNARVLDAACGSAYGSKLVQAAGARRVCAADIATDAFAEARRGGAGEAIQFVLTDATTLPFADRSFDLYTCFETIEHVDADQELVREASRVLAHDGVFLCSTPNRDLLSPGHTIDDAPRNPYHVREYSLTEFHRLLETAFESVELMGQTWFSKGHRNRLAAAGAVGSAFAVRLHQLRNIAGLPWEGPHRHEPTPLASSSADRVPEVFFAVCRNG